MTDSNRTRNFSGLQRQLSDNAYDRIDTDHWLPPVEYDRDFVLSPKARVGPTESLLPNSALNDHIDLTLIYACCILQLDNGCSFQSIKSLSGSDTWFNKDQSVFRSHTAMSSIFPEDFNAKNRKREGTR